jgi:hypothetical protein
MQEDSTTQPTNSPVDFSSNTQDIITINGAIALIAVLIPLTIFAGLKAYKKYRVAVLRQQINTLEKLWHLHSNNRKA